jgi:phosphoglycerate dehydrogenase-like enzyme
MGLGVPEGWHVEEIQPDGSSKDSWRVATVDKLNADGIAILHEHPQIEVIEVDENIDPNNPQKLTELFKKEIDGLIVRTTGDQAFYQNPGLLENAGKLRKIVRSGIGVSNPGAEAAMNGIAISRVQKPNRDVVTTYTIHALRRMFDPIGEKSVATSRQKWDKSKWDIAAFEKPLIGKTHFNYGAGGIGRQVIERAIEEGMTVLYTDPRVPEIPGAKRVSEEEGLSRADSISINIDTRNCILGDEQFSRMKSGVKIVNTSRGDCIDGRALKNALEEEIVSGVTLDVLPDEGQDFTAFNKEVDKNGKPIPLELRAKRRITAELVKHPLVTATSHIGGQEKAANALNGVLAARYIISYLLGGVVEDGWNIGNMKRNDHMFSNGETWILSVMNEDNKSGVWDGIHAAMNEVAERKINLGVTQSAKSVPLPQLKGEEKIRIATLNQQVELQGIDPEILGQMLQVARRVDGVLSLNLFKVTRRNT